MLALYIGILVGVIAYAIALILGVDGVVAYPASILTILATVIVVRKFQALNQTYE